jgi:hypothetical protein
MRSADLVSAYQHSQALARVGRLRVQGHMHALQYCGADQRLQGQEGVVLVLSFDPGDEDGDRGSRRPSPCAPEAHQHHNGAAEPN